MEKINFVSLKGEAEGQLRRICEKREVKWMKVIGYSRRCKICNSPHRATVEGWMTSGGMTLVEAEERSTKELGEFFSRTSIWRHMKDHFVNKEDIKKIYTNKKSEELAKLKVEEFNAAQEKSRLLQAKYVEGNLTELEKLDDMIEKDYAMYLRTVELMKEKLENKLAPKPLVDFLRVLNSNINTSLKTKAELLGTDAEGRKASVMETWIDIIGSVDIDD